MVKGNKLNYVHNVAFVINGTFEHLFPHCEQNDNMHYDNSIGGVMPTYVYDHVMFFEK